MSDSLLEFLRCGTLADIRLGMSSEDLRDALGEPHDVGYQRISDPADGSIWLCGSQGSCNLQLPLSNQRVEGIWLYLYGVDELSSLPRQLSASNWRITGRTTIRDFTAIMAEEGIVWKTYDTLTFDDQTCLVLQSQVQVLWAHDGHRGLEKIILTNGSHGWTP